MHIKYIRKKYPFFKMFSCCVSKDKHWDMKKISIEWLVLHILAILVMGSSVFIEQIQVMNGKEFLKKVDFLLVNFARWGKGFSWNNEEEANYEIKIRHIPKKNLYIIISSSSSGTGNLV